MGQLRFESKKKSQMSQEEYDHYRELLQSAQGMEAEGHVFYDLEEEENIRKVRTAIMNVAKQEAITVRTRINNERRSIQLIFSHGRSQKRLQRDQYVKGILKVLTEASEPLGKNEILKIADLPASNWSPVIRRLMDDGKVVREGKLRNAVYRLTESGQA